YLRARGDEVRFICGSDDNGVAALISARQEGTSVEELTARYNARQAADFKGLGIEFDIYGGTHQPGFVELHERLSREFFLSIHQKGFFTKKRTQQLFDVQAGQFLPDRYVKGECYLCHYAEAYGDQCENCGNSMEAARLINPVSTITGTRPELRETTHWYLQLDRFQEPLRQWLESKREPADGSPPWRETVLNFSLGQIKAGLPERAMTRDLSWGVPVPLDDPDAAGKVLYVWFDAPIGYVSFTARLCERTGGDWRDYVRWWKDPACRILHFIGEDNTVFHALTWPAMLMAEGTYQLPSNVVANAFLNIKFPGKEEEKISKSRGTAVWIEDYLKTFDPDPLRYYLTAIAPETARTAFDFDDFVSRNNGELGNALGNFVNRSVTFAHKYFEGRVPPAGRRGGPDLEQLALLARQTDAVANHLEHLRFKAALAEVMSLARASNGYFDVKKPWQTRKTDLADCGTAINVCLQTVRTLATLMAPFLPFSAAKCAAMLHLDPALPWSAATREIPEGQALGEPVILFKKLEAEEVLEG
ncbi:MAG: methionine--tRNA ligase, partial [Phycisphaerae bacterium]